MFKLNEKYEVNFSISKCEYIRYSPSEISKINTADSQIYIIIPGEDFVIFLLNRYLDWNFDVLHGATNNRYAVKNNLRLVNLGPIALSSNCKLTTSSGKHLEVISHAHNISLLYKLITSAKDIDDLSLYLEMFLLLLNTKKKLLSDSVKNWLWQEIVITLFWIKITQPTLVKLKLIVLNGMFHIIHQAFHKKLRYLNKIQVRYPQNFIMWKEMFWRKK